MLLSSNGTSFTLFICHFFGSYFGARLFFPNVFAHGVAVLDAPFYCEDAGKMESGQ